MKKSYASINHRLSALKAQQEACEREAIDTLARVLMASNSGPLLADLSKTELRAVARKLVSGLDGVINQVKTERSVKSVGKAREAQVSAMPSPAQQPQSKVLQQPAVQSKTLPQLASYQP